MTNSAPLEKDPARSLIIRGLAHDYKRVLRTLTVRAEEISSSAESAHAEKMYEAANSFLDQVDELINLLDDISNNLNEDDLTPVTSILSRYSSDINSVSDSLAKYAETIERYDIVYRLANTNLTKNIRLLSRQSKRIRFQISELMLMPLNEIKINIRSVNIQNEILRIVQDLYSVFNLYHADSEATVSVKVSSTIKVDRTMFAVAVSNIITNAIIHSNKNSKLQLKIDEVSDSAFFDKFVTLSFSDNGPGIKEIDRERIFLLFERGEADTQNYGGSGVGLTFAKFAMNRMGGDLWLEPHRADGSTFMLRFPRAIPGVGA